MLSHKCHKNVIFASLVQGIERQSRAIVTKALPLF
jgi:hypothetical protein